MNTRKKKWDEDYVVKFVKLYRTETVLWERSSFNYKNRDQTNAARMRIADAMNISVEVVGTLIRYVRNRYSKELHKISEDLNYIPSGVCFELLDSFLKSNRNRARRLRQKDLNPESPQNLLNPKRYFDLTTPTPPLLEQSNNDETTSLTESYINPQSEMYDGIRIEIDTNEQEDITSPMPTPPPLEPSNYDGTENETETYRTQQSEMHYDSSSGNHNKKRKDLTTPTLPPLESSSYKQTTSSETETYQNQQSQIYDRSRSGRHKKKQKVDEIDILSSINSTLEKLNTISEKAVSALTDDSFDCFGKYIASMLRGLPNHTALNIQGEMTSLLLKAHQHMSSNNDSITSHRRSGFNDSIPQVFSSGNIPENLPEGTCLVDL